MKWNFNDTCFAAIVEFDLFNMKFFVWTQTTTKKNWNIQENHMHQQ